MSRLSIPVDISQILKKKELLLSLGIILAGLFGAKYIFQKQQDKIRNINKGIAIEQQKLTLSKELFALHNKLIQISAPYLQKDTSFAVDKLKEILSRYGARIVSVGIEKEAPAELYQLTRYRLFLQAGYHSLGKFMSVIESLPEIIKIEEVSLAPQPQTVDSENILNVRMTLSTTFVRAE